MNDYIIEEKKVDEHNNILSVSLNVLKNKVCAII